MANIVERPAAAKGRINSKDEFELCYIRHQYLRKAKYNPSPEEMEPYKKIILGIAKRTHYTYYNLFKMVGLEYEDLASIGMVHLVSFLSLFAMDQLPPQKREKIFAKMRETQGYIPSSTDIIAKDKANLTIFVKQRMEDVVRICNQKAGNIKGLPTDEFFYYFGKRKPPKNLRLLKEDNQKYSFKKIDVSSFRSIWKKAGKPATYTFRFKGNWYAKVNTETKYLAITDFDGADLNPYDNLHNMDPEQIFFYKEEEKAFADKKAEFKSQPAKSKVKVLKEFVKANKNNPRFKEEVETARIMLKTLGA